MMDAPQDSGDYSDEMADYLQTFLDETEEQLDDLVETMLVLEQNATDKEDLNEAFRLIHSIKGSAGIMGFDTITALTHHLENRFERFRSGIEQLDEPTMNLVLRCIDFLRQCNNRLRDSEPLGSAAELLEDLRRLENQEVFSASDQGEKPKDELPGDRSSETDLPPASPIEEPAADDNVTRIFVQFRAGLQLADLKAQLIVARLARLGEVKSTYPDIHAVADQNQLETFEIRLETAENVNVLRAATDVDGVESIRFGGELAPEDTGAEQAAVKAHAELHGKVTDERIATAENTDPTPEAATPEATLAESEPIKQSDLDRATTPASSERAVRTTESPNEPPRLPSDSHAPAAEKVSSKVAETMRVQVDRLDNLMNLAGELVVNRARFQQISEKIRPELRQAKMLNRIRDFGDSLKQTIESIESLSDADGQWSSHLRQMRAGLKLMEEQSEVWSDGRQSLGQISEAIDHFSRVSQNLQSGVLDTRMVPVGPLFSRFKRVIRDLSKERGKEVQLAVRGEKTELDKRMIDELGDPLVHLVRNSVDHGLESPEVRIELGKPAEGTIDLDASHSGNNVTICVSDDGSGIDIGRIRTKLIENQILSEPAVNQLSDQQVLEYIWHPGFSTAKKVTDVSGRGVGMDVVKTRIQKLNGTVEVDSTPKQGTTFTIRLPLTLAIIKCLLIRIRNVVFSLPIDEVREIVAVSQKDVATVHGRQTFDVRNQYIPLASIDDVFYWHDIGFDHDASKNNPSTVSDDEPAKVVILHSGGKTMGLRVDELLGSQDIVIKSLSDNFVDIRGLSGASILGDGRVSLMLDVGTVIAMATHSSRTTISEDVAK